MIPRERPIPTLVYLYGPPAVGKLTVAKRLCVITGWTLFHNHLSVNAVRPIFPFGSKPFTDVVHRLRLDVFETAMAEGTNLIFTNNSAWGGSNGRERFATFADSARLAAETGGGQAQFVRLTAPLDVLETRLLDPTRQQLGKLTDTSRLRELLRALDDSALYDDDLTIDTSRHSPEEAAKTIAAYIARSNSNEDAHPTSG
jgi:hypothetical protein